jgi:hypothetical protein
VDCLAFLEDPSARTQIGRDRPSKAPAEQAETEAGAAEEAAAKGNVNWRAILAALWRWE